MDHTRIILSFHDGYVDKDEKFRTIRSQRCNAGAQPILNAEESIPIDKH